MYENYTRQALPSKEYRELLGTAICVFNSNNAFIIENILNSTTEYNWYELMDRTSGQYLEIIANTITEKANSKEIEDLFRELLGMRNRIIHSFQITASNGEQILATKTNQNQGNQQFHITKEYLMVFIKKNEELRVLLHQYRGY